MNSIEPGTPPDCSWPIPESGDSETAASPSTALCAQDDTSLPGETESTMLDPDPPPASRPESRRAGKDRLSSVFCNRSEFRLLGGPRSSEDLHEGEHRPRYPMARERPAENTRL